MKWMKYKKSETQIPGRHVLTQAASSHDCDVVIVNYNAGKLLADCVSSVVVADVARVIVVDNDSTDGSLKHLERVVENEKVLVILNGNNLGFAKACNIGADAATSHYLLFLNPDCVLEPDAVFQLHEVLAAGSDVGMVGGLLLNPDGTEQGGGRRAVPTPWRSFVRAFGLYRFAHRWPRLFFDFYLHKQPLPDQPIEVEAISGACMLVKREAMEDVGPWDEDYFLHCEDLDWCMRFRQKGWKVMFVPCARLTHTLGTCSRSRPIFVEWHKHKGMVRFYRKFFRHQYPGVLMGLVAVGVWVHFGVVACWKVVSGMGGKQEVGSGK